MFAPVTTNGIADGGVSAYFCHLLETTSSCRHPRCSRATFAFAMSLLLPIRGACCHPPPSSSVLTCYLHLLHEPDCFTTISARSMQPLLDVGKCCPKLYESLFQLRWR
mmetsp:Transcript_9111/g.16118  ORF Transcript_9111/g.16118 Transcript_9111/m.16118 type:complete len:108 (+) Transcript_9111:96-419(+)